MEGMTVFASRTLFRVLALCAFTVVASAGSTSDNRYPNELKGFRFYAKYLTPLRPGTSSNEAVRRVLGDTAAIERDGWRIVPTYSAEHERLAEIVVIPEGVIPFAAVRFPASFAHCHESVSEINISFDVYNDTSGLEYWLHEEDSNWGKKGDLYRIVYGPRRRPYPVGMIC
jgi:hypothetical protein